MLEIPFQTWQQDNDVCFEVHYADNYIIDKYIIAMVRWRIRPLTFFSSSHQMIHLHWLELRNYELVDNFFLTQQTTEVQYCKISNIVL